MVEDLFEGRHHLYEEIEQDEKLFNMNGQYIRSLAFTHLIKLYPLLLGDIY